jgi:hypothetical protein
MIVSVCSWVGPSSFKTRLMIVRLLAFVAPSLSSVTLARPVILRGGKGAHEKRGRSSTRVGMRSLVERWSQIVLEDANKYLP